MSAGTINVTALGCPSDTGIGKGSLGNSSLCAGGGAAYAGNGGIPERLNSSIAENECSKTFPEMYGTYNDYYMYEGSGGGSVSNSGTGG